MLLLKHSESTERIIDLQKNNVRVLLGKTCTQFTNQLAIIKYQTTLGAIDIGGYDRSSTMTSSKGYYYYIDVFMALILNRAECCYN